jgi:hypothetical protein
MHQPRRLGQLRRLRPAVLAVLAFATLIVPTVGVAVLRHVELPEDPRPEHLRRACQRGRGRKGIG